MLQVKHSSTYTPQPKAVPTPTPAAIKQCSGLNIIVSATTCSGGSSLL